MTANDPTDDEQSPIECKICGAAITGGRPVEVMYTVEFPNVDKADPTVYLCDECAPDEE